MDEMAPGGAAVLAHVTSREQGVADLHTVRPIPSLLRPPPELPERTNLR